MAKEMEIKERKQRKAEDRKKRDEDKIKKPQIDQRNAKRRQILETVAKEDRNRQIEKED